MMTRTRDLTIGIVATVIAAIVFCWYIAGCSPVHVVVRARATTSRALDLGGMTDAQCVELMDKRDGAQLAGKILAGVGGVSALATAPDSVPDGARWGIGAGAATAAAVSVGVLWYGERKSDEFERYCEVDEETDEYDLAPNPFAEDGGVE